MSEYNCEFCNKLYSTKSNFKRHQITCIKKLEYLHIEKIRQEHDEREKLNNTQLTKLQSDYSKLQSDYSKLQSDYLKLQAELSKLTKQNRAYEIEVVELRAINKTLEKSPRIINNNVVHNNTNTQNIGHKYVMNEFSPLKQQFINEEMQSINLRNTNRPLEELSNHVNKSRIGLNFCVKDKSRKQITYLDEDSNESSDSTKLGEQIYLSIIDHVNDILYSEHKGSNKVYRKQIEQLSKNCTDTYNKIISDCIKFAKSPDQIKTIQNNLKDKFKQIKDKITELVDSYEPENENIIYHFKYGIDAVICFILMSIKEFIVIKNRYLFIKTNTDTNILEIKDSEKYIQTFIYESLLDNSKTLIKSCKKLKKQYKDFEDIIQETIEYLSTDKDKLKIRIDNKIADLE